MAEPLRQTLARTGFRASLTADYQHGHAPAAQRREGHAVAPAPTYHDRPALKSPDWTWYIPAYFFVGGVAGGAYVVSAILDVGGRVEDRPLVRSGRLVALAGLLASPLFLILDLGRPERWFNMMRVFRPRSMMNQGSWILLLSGAFAGLAVAVEGLHALAWRRRAAARLARVLRPLTWLGVVPTTALAAYTGLLLSATNVPLWTRARTVLTPLFLSSALSTGLAATHLGAAATGLRGGAAARVSRTETLLVGSEVALTGAVVAAAGSAARPLLTGRLGWVLAGGAIGLGMLTPLAIKRLAPAGGRAGAVSAALTLIGGAVLRYAVTEGGKRSARDPRAYFANTRHADEAA